MPREGQQSPRPARTQYQPSPPRRGPQKGHRQCLIIAGQGGPSNVEALGGEVKLKLRNEFQHAVPRAAIRRGRPAQPQDVGAHPASHSRREPGQQLDAYPRAEVARITVRRVVVRSEEHTSELQSPCNLVCRLLLEKKKMTRPRTNSRCTIVALASWRTYATYMVP